MGEDFLPCQTVAFPQAYRRFDIFIGKITISNLTAGDMITEGYTVKPKHPFWRMLCLFWV